MNAKRVILYLAKYSGCFRLCRRLTSRRLRILAYHGIWLGPEHFGNFLFMSAGRFASRMSLLQQAGYPVVSLQRALQADGQLPDCATVITIDDGWYGTYASMLPVLEQYGYPATVYLTTYYCQRQEAIHDVALQYLVHRAAREGQSLPPLPDYEGIAGASGHTSAKDLLDHAYAIMEQLPGEDARQAFLNFLADSWGLDWNQIRDQRWFHLMSPDEVRDAARRGIDFELHTHRHRLSHRGQDTLAQEISLNREILEDLTGAAPQHFCYPSGRYTPALWPQLEAEGVRSATTTETGLARPDGNPMALPRILDGEDIGDIEFEAEMSGFLELCRTLTGRRPGSRQSAQAEMSS